MLPNIVDSISEQESEAKVNNNVTEQKCEWNIIIDVCTLWADVRNKKGRISLKHYDVWNKNKQVTSKDHQFIWIKTMCS